ncbi:exodeoxyribonuclease III [Mariprofundus sp. EBB-1]|uniref:exodeoxyribonuclease III n=1 Tax=Mariprofundus sp. EBB-1 TaxID=2650971 RepID=UPI000EF23F72|nr:exodeoxyribonuclease III [Mariprofundus sp. EBB-1]RLL53521.1 exodeoxyribonuclease III [Mariprofundus sp. EBB-1]
MKIVTWNVNSLTVRLPHVLMFLEEEKPDVLALQETKTVDSNFPYEAIEAAGYHVTFSGQKTYNGVALLSRSPASDEVMDIPDFSDPQRRLLAATIDGVRIINIYIPNGQEVGSEKYDYKFHWLIAFRNFLKTELTRHQHLIVLGDYNIAPTDLDIHDPDRWSGKIMCSDAEREWFQSLLKLGLTDTVRQLHPDQPMHSWWDYRMNAFRRHWGIRIDHLLATPSMIPTQAGVASTYRALERPSDHAPVWVDFSQER